MGFQFKPNLAAVLAVLNGASVGLAYIVSQGNITATSPYDSYDHKPKIYL